MKAFCYTLWLWIACFACARAEATTSQHPQYLMFQIFTYPGLSGPVVPIPEVVKTIVATVGNTGTNNQKLGFVAGPLTFDHSDAQLKQTIDDAFTAADTYNVAFMLHIDDSMFWKSRTDLTSKTQNVEWTSWSGKSAGPRVLPWYSSATLAPQMCYNSPGIKAAISALVKNTIGPEIRKGLALLTAKGKANLFAGVIVGWETQLPDVSPGAGYCALTNLGYSAAKPPSSLHSELPKVVTSFIGYWEQQFIAAGVDASKLYTHIAVPPPGGNVNNAPIAAAFSASATAGFTVYGTANQTYSQIYQAVQLNKAKRWGVSEGSNVFPPNAMPGGSGKPDEPMASYLGQAYYNCASYVNLFGWQATGSAFQKALLDRSALDAYRLFLSGAYGVPAKCAS